MLSRSDIIKLAAALALSIVSTPLILWLIYGDRAYAWPWVQFSVTLTMVTGLFPFCALWFADGDRAFIDGAAVIYGFGYAWLPLLLFYPGTRALGVVSDGKAIWWFGICWAQGFCAWIIARTLYRAQQRRSGGGSARGA